VLGIQRTALPVQPPSALEYRSLSARAWKRVRTLHAAHAFAGPGEPLVTDAQGKAVWLWLPQGLGGILLLGTDLAGDLVRYRQGDPAKVGTGPKELWGFAFERPVHLFEGQLAGEFHYERHADWWCEALCHAVCGRATVKRAAILPEGRPGALVVTGDDDQAELSKYAEQLAVLNGLPVTYFLHPLTRHTRRTLRKLERRGGVDLGLHPDALDQPKRYGELLAEQAAWFQQLTLKPPVSVRNHGFLSDGYWGHLRHWLEEDISISSNIPGLNGRVLNGSLLPGRVVSPDGDALTAHWSLLTAIGDGVVFLSGMTAKQSAECVLSLVGAVRESAVPGVIVLNLHPQNIAQTRSMHEAVLAAARQGFLPWTMRDCLAWFSSRDGHPLPAASPRQAGSSGWSRIKALLRAHK
jgi:hypothetical protein